MPDSEDLERSEDLTPGEAFQRASQELVELTAEAVTLQGSGEPGTDLVPARSDDPVEAKRQMAAVRSQAQRVQQQIKDKRAEMERLMKQQLALANEVLEPMQQLVERIEQSLFTVNLYLGRDEEIKMLRDGESAPADEPIALRQALLFMAEECAVAAEDGGIAPNKPELFDQWLLEDPSHLDQVLPERKGIVCLRPRRNIDRYSSSPAAREMAEANKRTYWLVRNGDRLYRTFTALEVADDRVLPYADEFERLFTTRGRDGSRKPLRPGSYDWDRAQEQAEETERKYMRVGLLLEGLLHRTPIFHPLHPSGVSFIDPADVQSGKVRYITDAEGLLGTGAETFEQWRHRLAEDLQVGMRVVLGPGLEEYKNEYSFNKNDRLTPPHANLPNPGEVFTVEDRKGSSMVFRFREGKRWVEGKSFWDSGTREPKRRASCRFVPSDKFILPFDNATVEEMERFLTTRTDRHQFEEMWPILKSAIAAKHDEAAKEAPFREMLAGVLARENDVTVEAAREEVPDLISWFKFKNRYHRPLVAAAHQDALVDKNAAGEDWEPKAVRMITAEHKARLKDRSRGFDEKVVAKLAAAHPEHVAIVRPRGKGYLVIDAAERDKDVWVHEVEYSAKGVFKGRRDWVLPGVSRPRQWMVCKSTDRWENWDLRATDRDHLRGPEREALIAQVLDDVQRRRIPGYEADDFGDDFDEDFDDEEDEGGDASTLSEEVCEPLALAFDNDREFTLWIYTETAALNREHPLTGRQRLPKVKDSSRTWRRERGEVVLSDWGYAHEISGLHHDKTWPWDKEKWRGSYFPDEELDAPAPEPQHNVIWRDGTAEKLLRDDLTQYEEVSDQADSVRNRARKLKDSMVVQWLNAAWAEERKRFDEDFGDPDLWEGHKKSKEKLVVFPYHDKTSWSTSDFHKPTTIHDALHLMLEGGEDPRGMTVGEVLAHATETYGEYVAAEQSRRDHFKDYDSWKFTAPKELHDLVLDYEDEPTAPELEAGPDGGYDEPGEELELAEEEELDGEVIED